MKEEEERKAELDEDDMMFTYTKTEVLNKKSKNKKKLLLNKNKKLNKKNKKLLSKKSKSIVKKALTNAVSNTNCSINTRRKAMLNSLNTINNKNSETEITTTKSASLIDSELNKFKKLEKQKQQQNQQKQQQQQQQQQNKKNKENESKSNIALNKTVEGKSTTRRSGKKGTPSTNTELKNESSTSSTTLETPSATNITTTNKLGNKKSKSVSSLLMLSASSSSSNFDNDLHLDKNNAINHLNEMLKMTKYTGAFSNESTNLKLFNNTLNESDNENEYSFGELSKQQTTTTMSQVQPTTSAGALRSESQKKNEAKKIKKLIGSTLDSDDVNNKSLKRGRKPKKIPTQPIKYLTGSVESSSTGDNYLSKLNDQIKSQMLMNKKETITNILEHSQSSSSNPFISSQSQSPIRTLPTSPVITSVAKSNIITKISPLSVIRTIVRPSQGMPTNSLTIPSISNPKTTLISQQQQAQSILAVKSQSHPSLQTISNRPSAAPAIQVLNQNPKPILVTKRVNQPGVATNPINLPLTTPLGKPLTFLSNQAAAPAPGKVVIRAFNTQPSTINIMNKPASSNQIWVLNQPGGQPTAALNAKPAATAVSTNSAASVAATVAAAVAAETSQNLISSFLKQQQQQQQPVIKTIVNNNIFTSNTNNYVINNSNNYTIIANPNSSSSKSNASSNSSVDTQLVLNKLNEKFQN